MNLKDLATAYFNPHDPVTQPLQNSITALHFRGSALRVGA